MKIELYIPEAACVSVAEIAKSGNVIDIHCIKENDGLCPADNPFLFIKSLHKALSGALNAAQEDAAPDISAYEWYIHKGWGCTKVDFVTGPQGIISHVHIGNFAVRHNEAFSLLQILEKQQELSHRMHADIMPATVFPAPCAEAKQGYIYWQSPYDDKSDRILWVDSARFTHYWHRTTATRKNAVPHVETTVEQAKEYGGFLLDIEFFYAYAVAEISCGMDKGQPFIGFTNGRHRFANAAMFGCPYIPVRVHDEREMECLKQMAGSSAHYDIKNQSAIDDSLRASRAEHTGRESSTSRHRGLNRLFGLFR